MQTKSERDILAIVPARGGSKGIPKKNIHPFQGKPLIAYTIESLLASKVVDTVWVTTDSEEIAAVAKRYQAQVIYRPDELSGDSASTESALIHAIETLKSQDVTIPQYVLTLQPTSPLRTASTIQAFVEHFVSVANEYDAMLTLTESRDDVWVRTTEGQLQRMFPHAPRRRQDRQPIYFENGALYITKIEALLKTNSILGTRNTGFVISQNEGIDINEPIDLLLAEMIFEQLPH